MAINKYQLSREQNHERLFELINTTRKEDIPAAAAEFGKYFSGQEYPIQEGKPQTLSDENEKALAGRFLWENGIRSYGLDDTTRNQGILLEPLESIQKNAPEIAKKLQYWQESLVTSAYENIVNAAIRETLVLYVPKFAVVSKELLLDIVLSEQKRNALIRVWVYLEAGAQAVFTINLRSRKVVEENFYAGSLQVFVGDGAHLILNEIQDFHQKVKIIASKTVTVGKVSNLQWNICELGAAQLNYETDLEIKGEGSHSLVYGLYFASNNQVMNLKTHQNHFAPNTSSYLHYKGAIKDDAYANWQGMIYVDPNARKTDGFQKNENLMLSPNAHVFTKPGLEIITDDVKCSHGTTISEIDANQIFYLMSRGIPEVEAKLLILQGYFDSILNNITYEPIREKLKEKILLKMGL